MSVLNIITFKTKLSTRKVPLETYITKSWTQEFVFLVILKPMYFNGWFKGIQHIWELYEFGWKNSVCKVSLKDAFEILYPSKSKNNHVSTLCGLTFMTHQLLCRPQVQKIISITSQRYTQNGRKVGLLRGFSTFNRKKMRSWVP